MAKRRINRRGAHTAEFWAKQEAKRKAKETDLKVRRAVNEINAQIEHEERQTKYFETAIKKLADPTYSNTNQMMIYLRSILNTFKKKYQDVAKPAIMEAVKTTVEEVSSKAYSESEKQYELHKIGITLSKNKTAQTMVKYGVKTSAPSYSGYWGVIRTLVKVYRVDSGDAIAVTNTYKDVRDIPDQITPEQAKDIAEEADAIYTMRRQLAYPKEMQDISDFEERPF